MRITVLTDLATPPTGEDGRCDVDCPVCSCLVPVEAGPFHRENRDWRLRQGPEVVTALAALPRLSALVAGDDAGRAVGFVRCPCCGALFCVVTGERAVVVVIELVLHVAIERRG